MRPGLTNVSVPPLDEVEVPDELGRVHHVYILGERPLTVHLDKHELVTLMTLGDTSGVLVLGCPRDQHLVSSVEDIVSVQVDWETGSAAMSTHVGVTDLSEKTTRRTVTTGCGRGTVFNSPMDGIDAIHLPPNTRMTQITLYRVMDTIRLQQLIYKQAGSVHGCVLLDARGQLLHFIEGVGRRDTVGAIAGHMQFGGMEGGDRIFYTIGCLISEMVIKGAQMDIPFLLSRSGVTQMGYQMMQWVGLMSFTRCTGRYFLLYTGWDRFMAESGVVGMVGPRGGLLQAVEPGRRSAHVCPDKTDAGRRPSRGFPSQVWEYSPRSKPTLGVGPAAGVTRQGQFSYREDCPHLFIQGT